MPELGIDRGQPVLQQLRQAWPQKRESLRAPFQLFLYGIAPRVATKYGDIFQPINTLRYQFNFSRPLSFFKDQIDGSHAHFVRHINCPLIARFSGRNVTLVALG